MTNIKSPYNFVPLNEKVVTPEWADFISHDVPFEEAQSGELKLRMEAKSPMFVANGLSKVEQQAIKDKKVDKLKFFSSLEENQYFLPGTSLKGMVRNVLEILSFSKMGNKITDKTFAFRDFHNKDLYDPSYFSNNVKTGWLYKSGERYLLQPCGHGRIPFSEIAKALGKPRDIQNAFSSSTSVHFSEDDNEQKTAKYKYELLEITDAFVTIPVEKHEEKNNNKPKVDKRIFYKSNAKSDLIGTIVLTGQPGLNKKYDFIFFENAGTPVQIEQDIIDSFFNAYLDGESADAHPVDWAFRKQQLESGKKIPVFFLKDGHNVKSIGLSLLYKLAYKNSIRALAKQSGSDNIDFSEAIFGYITDDDEFHLKGRVQFGHAFANNTVQVDEEKKEVLSSPKASYYPNYIQQKVEKNGVGRYNTYMDDGAKIAGWKRYPVHRGSAVSDNPPPREAKEDLLTKFTPIKTGAVFTGTVRYHNLHPIELGALLSSLTFHGMSDTFHSLGMAKPLGYGKVTVTVEGIKNPEYYIGLFEAYMEEKCPGWIKSPQIKELLTMATEQQRNEGNAELTYMKLDQERRKNDFTDAKQAKEALQVYTELEGIQGRTFATKATSEQKKAVKQAIETYKALAERRKQSDNGLSEEQNRFQEALEAKKKKWLDLLSSQKQLAEQREAQHQKGLKVAKFRQTTPDWTSIDWNSRNDAFRALENLIKRYCQAYYGDNNYDRIVKNHPEGVLPEAYRPELLERLKGLYKLQSPKEQEKWRNTNSFILRKVAEWIGEAAAQTLQQQWSNI